MADDIVTRLRDVVCWCNEFDGVCDACQAADEIERLRAALTVAAAAPHGCSTGFFPCWCEEARRG